MRNERRYSRLGERYGGRVLLTFLGLAFTLVVIFAFFWAINAHDRRLTIAIAGDPTTVATFDFTDHKLIILSFPPTAQIPGVHGAGQYSLTSLWQLGLLHPQDPALLRASLEEATGLPIDRYLGFKNNEGNHYSSSLNLLKQIFSFSKPLNFLSGRYISNLTPADFLLLSWQTMSLRPDSITTLEVNERTALFKQKQPDGTTVPVVDPNKLDVLIGESFEDQTVRSESLRVAIYNTTSTPELGSRVERLLAHTGILVVLLGNDTPEIGGCKIDGSKQALATKTAKFISKTYGCSLVRADNGGRADLEVKIGREFEKLFLPKN